MGDDAPVRLGFACAWDAERERTWSGTAWAVRQALAARAELIDLAFPGRSWARPAVKLASLRRRGGQWVSPWAWSAAWSRWTELSLSRRAGRSDVDAVLEIGDLGRLDVPFFTYQDLSAAVVSRFLEHGSVPGWFRGLTPRLVDRRVARQQRFYERVTGVFAMSEWFARSLVDEAGVEPSKIHVVYAGIHALPDDVGS